MSMAQSLKVTMMLDTYLTKIFWSPLKLFSYDYGYGSYYIFDWFIAFNYFIILYN